MCDLTKYSIGERRADLTYVADYKGQIILRINANLLMSLSIVLIFYFFVRYYSWGAGIYSLLLSLSSFMVWAHWVEARPYVLWFFLTRRLLR